MVFVREASSAPYLGRTILEPDEHTLNCFDTPVNENIDKRKDALNK